MNCCRCKLDKDESEFPFRNKAQGIRQGYCKECKKEYNKTWYSNEKNRAGQIARASKNGKIYLDRLFAWKVEYVANHGGCSWEDCEVKHPVMIEFDHIDRAEKTYDISVMIRKGMSIQMIEKEAEKCRLLCANHHRLHTAHQMGWRIASVSPLPPKQLKA